MITDTTVRVSVETRLDIPVEHVWKYWNGAEHIVKWYIASPDWHTPRAENDPRVDGRFLYRMEAKDGSFGFDFSGKYTRVIPYTVIEYTLDDSRKVHISFTAMGKSTRLVETFDTENQNPVEMQRNGWQAILDHFQQYATEHYHLTRF